MSETKPQSPTERKTLKQQELDEHMRLEKKKRIMFAGIAGILIIAILALGYFFYFKPWNDAMNLVKQSEQLIAEKNYTQALKDIARAHILAPNMKGLNYRAGLIQMLQMNYSDAEDLFNIEVKENGHVAGGGQGSGSIRRAPGSSGGLLERALPGRAGLHNQQEDQVERAADLSGDGRDKLCWHLIFLGFGALR